MKSDETTQQLREAARGLLYPSESDAEIRVARWGTGAIDEGHVRKAKRVDPDAPVTRLPSDAFFEPVTRMEEWFDEEERAVAERFKRLEALAREHLTDLAAFRVGETDVDLYLLGCDPDGEVVALETHLVET